MSALGLAAASSEEKGRAAAEKLERISNDELGPGEEVVLCEDELNSYLLYEVAEQIPPGVRDLRVRLLKDVGVVTGYIDFSRLSSNSSSSPGMLLLSLLRGERAVRAEVFYVSASGMGRAEIRSFKVDGREMQGAVLDWLVSTFVAPNFDGFELGEATPLGHQLDEVRLETGRMVFVGRLDTARR